ncbi:TetR/AcrR family transcriptional regulator [Aeromicrobium sp. Leaf350]|uniref:TetR/AcrR family transcriptional regulator n=1 Tax=Aeromicrobium sp. Leaf350 TaxID=2876565 RepID=UPI001E4D955A|nr:TetR/AcrR family transcriptional regulator [Aeromicrobium sp. Leaf350]
MPEPAHRPSQRPALLDAALGVVRDGESLSLESAARAAGVTKPGLMYHFATKEALVAALVDHVLDRHETTLAELLPQGPAAAEASDRIAAYARWALSFEHDAADLVLFSDPRLREQMAERWATRFAPWVHVPSDLPAEERARLQAVRLMADGSWFADATSTLPVPPEDREALLATALDLIGRNPS